MLPREAVVKVGGTASGRASVSGVKRCRSYWACECCAPAIGERRAAELDAAFAQWQRMGGTVLFLTATIGHDLGDDLDALMDLLQSAWSRTFRWEAARFGQGEDTMGMLLNSEYGPGRYRPRTWKGGEGRTRPEWYAGQSRTVEVTHGAVNGWHPHVHAAIFVEPGCDPKRSMRALRRLGVRWQASVEALGGRCRLRPVRDRFTGKLVIPGWHVRTVDEADAAANYLTKVEGGWGAGLELARLDLKRGKGTTPFGLLRAAVEGDQAAEALFLEYERVTAGRDRIISSPGLLARCQVVEATDDEAVEGSLDGETIAAAADVPARHWRALWRQGEAAALVGVVVELGKGTYRPGTWKWPPGWLDPVAFSIAYP